MKWIDGICRMLIQLHFFYTVMKHIRIKKYRIEESVLVKNVNLLLEEVINMKDKYVKGQSGKSSEQYFEILNRNAFQNVNTESEYKNFICDYLNQQSSQEYDNVKLKDFKWTCQLESYKIYDDKIVINTKPHTDQWKRTYYHFQNDNAPVLQIETDEKYFSFVVKTEFESKVRFDQCGIV